MMMHPTELIANVIFLVFVAGIPLIAWYQRVAVFDEFIAGAKSGVFVTIKIIPYLVAFIVAIGMFRASGALLALEHWVEPLTSTIGIPSEVLPLALVRPFSGSASNGMLAELIHQYGGNALVSHMAATIIGSTETTFYVLAVYFGVVGITRSRHAILVGLLADATGVIAAVWICRWLLA